MAAHHSRNRVTGPPSSLTHARRSVTLPALLRQLARAADGRSHGGSPRAQRHCAECDQDAIAAPGKRRSARAGFGSP
jgi:hypothetical protein